jgi:hypothetical protein
LAFASFYSHAQKTGNATAQAYIAFFYSTGYHGVVPVDQAKAQLYYTFAANGGDKGAQMALGYRHWSGIGTRESCERAVGWYEAASEKGKQIISMYEQWTDAFCCQLWQNFSPDRLVDAHCHTHQLVCLIWLEASTDRAQVSPLQDSTPKGQRSRPEWLGQQGKLGRMSSNTIS